MLALITWSQDTNKPSKRNKTISDKIIRNDTLAINIQEMKDSIDRSLQNVYTPTPDYDKIGQNMAELMRYQEERKAKQKRNAMIRIGIGVAMLILLIVGLRRKRTAVK